MENQWQEAALLSLYRRELTTAGHDHECYDGAIRNKRLRQEFS
jgi:hypothetical protein